MKRSLLLDEAKWPPDFPESVFLGRAAKQLGPDNVWNGLRSGELEPQVYCVGRTDFNPIRIAPMAFLHADRAQTLFTCQIEVRETDRRRSPRNRRLVPVPHWLYVTRGSLARFSKKSAAAPGESPARYFETRILKRPPLPDESVRSRGRLPASSPATQPAPAPVDEQPDHDVRSSRRRGDNGHARPARDIARIVLRRLFPDGVYPTKEQLSNRNLLKRVDKSWDANEGEANGKLTKASLDYIKKPSDDSFLREAGRKD
jgi:hypothetical protein